MKSLLKLIAKGVVAGMFIVFFSVFGTLMGAFSGWAVGLFFADTILPFFSYIFGASHGFQMWQIGASLGFIGGFLRIRVKGGGFGMTSFKDWMAKWRAEAEADAIIDFDPRQPTDPLKPRIVRG